MPDKLLVKAKSERNANTKTEKDKKIRILEQKLCALKKRKELLRPLEKTGKESSVNVLCAESITIISREKESMIRNRLRECGTR